VVVVAAAAAASEVAAGSFELRIGTPATKVDDV